MHSIRTWLFPDHLPYEAIVPSKVVLPIPRLDFVEWVSCAFSSGRDKHSVAAYVSIGPAGKNVQMARYPKSLQLLVLFSTTG